MPSTSLPMSLPRDLAHDHGLDVPDTASVHRFFAEQPAFHILVNNAGTNRPKPMWEVS